MRTTSAIRLYKTVALALSLIVAITLSLAPTAGATTRADRDTNVVAQNALGEMTSQIVGTTADGSRVTGTFTPSKFIQQGDQVLVRGVLDGVVHGDRAQSFTATRTLSVASVQGLECGILDLVLGPLDLDLLGLQVHLDQVVLTIIAVTGANNLLGNLLCAVTGLLDGVAVIGQIIALLNEILDLFRPVA